MESEIYEKAFRVTLKLIENNIRNLRWIEVAICGIYASFPNYDIPQNDETCQAMKDAILSFLEKYETKFANEEAFDFWQKLNHASFNFKSIYDKDYAELKENSKIPKLLFM
jgi:hypothetical protein